ncbi:MAG: TnpV protein [Oscillospiraceae bacterium]|nr:TnpV protein [Oscillospiraceae bacterium]
MTENGINYILDEETGTYLPDLKLTETEEQPIGKFGQMRLTYLKEHRNPIYQAMCLEGTLYPHLREIERTAQKRLAIMLPEMMKSEGVTEELKAADQMKWVGLMNNIQKSAEEIIQNELIYA